MSDIAVATFDITAAKPTRRTLPFPFNTGVEYNGDQVLATAEHAIAISDWVPTERAIALVTELFELADDEDIVIDESGETRRLGTDEQAAQYALLAVRLISVFGLAVVPQECLGE